MSNPPPKKAAIRNPGPGGSGPGGSRGPQAPGNTVKFARRTPSGRYVSLSREDIDMEGELGADYANYTVHIPPTPDNQPMMDGAEPASVAMKAEEQYVSNSLFTGGFNSVTRAHLMDKVIESDVSHPQMAGSKGASRCGMPGCDGKVMRTERGEEVYPCECRFRICRDCYLDAQKDGCLCPGCKEHYKIGEYADDDPADGKHYLPGPGGMNTSKSLLARNQNGEFDHNRWLFETKGTYGYGNAIWPQDGADDDADGGAPPGPGHPKELLTKPWRPLTRKLRVPAAVISPYR